PISTVAPLASLYNAKGFGMNNGNGMLAVIRLMAPPWRDGFSFAITCHRASLISFAMRVSWSLAPTNPRMNILYLSRYGLFNNASNSVHETWSRSGREQLSGSC